MNENMRRELEEKLKKLIDNSDQAKARKEKKAVTPARGNVIRRRAGEKDKRFTA